MGGVPGCSQVFPAVMPATLITEIASWKGLDVDTSVNMWPAQAAGTANTAAATSATSDAFARRGRSRRKRGQCMSISILIRRPSYGRSAGG